MFSNVYSLNEIPDLTLVQYSAEESGGIDGIVKQHTPFFRQLNRKGILFGDIYQIIYFYNPDYLPGQKLKIYFRVFNENNPVCVSEILDSSPLSPFFHFERVPEKNADLENVFNYQVTLVKNDSFISSSFPDNNNSFYSVSTWKPNEKARLMSLFRMMQKIDKRAAYVVTLRSVDCSESMRASFMSMIQFIKKYQKSNQSIKDDNAEECVKQYTKFLNSLRNNPHFYCSIRAFSDDLNIAKMLIDAAASEAVEEGTYRLCDAKGQFKTTDCSLKNIKTHIDNAPRGMYTWNTLFLLKEIVPFCMFPALYPGESIEIPKESAPSYKKNGLYLGVDNFGYDVYFPLNFLTKHALIAGMPGSGKTYSMLHISSNLAGVYDIPILVLEPAKKEYRALTHHEKLKDLTVFSPGAPGSFPLRINPFEFPVGIKLSEHITNLNLVFEGAFDLTPPMPFLVSNSIEQVYRDHGWYPFEVNDGLHSYPNIKEFYDKIAEILEMSDYAPENKSNLKSVLQVRIGSLIAREMGNVFNVPSSTFAPDEWLKKKCVIELESLGPDAANFLTLLLLTLIREVLRKDPKYNKEKPRHVIFLEEAHNLIGPTTVSNSENGDAKVASTKYIVDMLAEVRALGEAIIIADQLPTSLAPQVTKNTSLKIAHRISAMDDRQLLASTMLADGVQFEQLGSFTAGNALCSYEDIQKPFKIKIHKYDGLSDAPYNDELFDILKSHDVYIQVMQKDCEIMLEKFKSRYKEFASKSKLEMFIILVKKYEKVLKDLSDPDVENKKELQDFYKRYNNNVIQNTNGLLELVLETIDYYNMNKICTKKILNFIIELVSNYEVIIKRLFIGDFLTKKGNEFIEREQAALKKTFNMVK